MAQIEVKSFDSPDETREFQSRSLAVSTCILVLAAIVLAGPAPVSADGTQRFNYKVVGFDYVGKGYVSGSRESTGACVPGSTSSINGFSDTFPGSLTVSPKFGRGELTIGNQGTRGVVDAKEYVDFRQHGAYEVVTACEMGAPSATSRTICDDTITSKVGFHAAIKGTIGNLVKITWTIRQEEISGAWFPDFICGDVATFQTAKCKSAEDIERLTRPKAKLKFTCSTPSLITTPPAGSGYDRYEALSNISGVLKLKTTVDRK